MSTAAWAPDEPDELDRRIRSLEAERLRPVPGAPVLQNRPTTAAEVSAARREAHDLHMIEEHLEEVARRRALLDEIGDEDEVPEEADIHIGDHRPSP